MSFRDSCVSEGYRRKTLQDLFASSFSKVDTKVNPFMQKLNEAHTRKKLERRPQSLQTERANNSMTQAPKISEHHSVWLVEEAVQEVVIQQKPEKAMADQRPSHRCAPLSEYTRKEQVMAIAQKSKKTTWKATITQVAEVREFFEQFLGQARVEQPTISEDAVIRRLADQITSYRLDYCQCGGQHPKLFYCSRLVPCNQQKEELIAAAGKELQNPYAIMEKIKEHGFAWNRMFFDIAQAKRAGNPSRKSEKKGTAGDVKGKDRKGTSKANKNVQRGSTKSVTRAGSRKLISSKSVAKTRSRSIREVGEQGRKESNTKGQKSKLQSRSRNNSSMKPDKSNRLSSRTKSSRFSSKSSSKDFPIVSGEGVTKLNNLRESITNKARQGKRKKQKKAKRSKFIEEYGQE